MAAVLSATLALAGVVPATAAVPHRVMPGETLWSIAAANNLTTRSVAVYNGLDEDADVVLGATIEVPTEAEAAAALESAGVGPAATDDQGSSGSGGAYVVQGGDTLSEIAERAGASANELAERNGVATDGVLLAGTVLQLPAGEGDVAASDESTDDGGGEGSSSPPPSSSGPVATGEQVSSAEIASIAEAHGVPGSLAAAIAWQESGFDNSVVSSADARGVMQIIPDTWDFVQDSLAASPLSATSAQANVHAGVMFLKYLLDETGGDPASAAASYYQGLASVRSGGMLPETRRYVDNVLALRSRFGGP